MKGTDLVSARLLKACKLWKGSILESSFLYGGGITRDLLASRIWTKVPADATKDEIEWQEAMKETLEKGWDA